MHQQAVDDLKKSYPFLSTVLRFIGMGGVIKENDPLWPTYLVARQKGFVHRIGEDGKTIAVSSRGEEYRKLSRK